MKKLYKCPECNVSNPAEKWNAETIIKFRDSDILKIEDCDEDVGANFYCPNCEYLVDSLEIEIYDKTQEDETVTISKAEYEQLLEIKWMYENLG